VTSGAPRRALLAGAALAAVAVGAARADDCRGLRFVDVAGEAGVDARHESGARGEFHLPETMGAGVAWLDYDGDGWLDLYSVQSGPFPPSGDAPAGDRLFRNRGDGRFEEASAATGSGGRGYGQGVLAVDYDGDGASDLYLANFGRDRLLRNGGDGRFTDVTEAVGLAVDGWSSSVSAADYDGDGWLDLYVARYVEYDPEAPLFCGDADTGERGYCHPELFTGVPDVLLRNLGGETFADASAAAGLPRDGARGLGVVFVDLDGDLRPDVYVANDLDANTLLRNLGDGRFEDVSLASGAAFGGPGVAQAGMGVAAADLFGDGRPHLVVTNFDVETNALYRNRGGLLFEDVSAESGFGPPSFNRLGFGVVAADFDRDGQLDVYVTNGHIFARPKRDSVGHAQVDLLLRGLPGGRFEAVECGPAFAARHVGRGLASGDYDNDGSPDLAISTNGGPLRLVRVEGAGGGWVGLRLRGRGGNREAVGARAVLAGPSSRQTRWVTAGDSYQSSSERRLLFALPEPAGATLDVVWPSGRRQRFVAPPRERYLTLVEPPAR
jgi:hypothetical protein